jgi:hypothetical protein
MSKEKELIDRLCDLADYIWLSPSTDEEEKEYRKEYKRLSQQLYRLRKNKSQ